MTIASTLQAAASEILAGAVWCICRREYSTPGYAKRYAIAVVPAAADDSRVTFPGYTADAHVLYLVSARNEFLECLVLPTPLRAGEIHSIAPGWVIDGPSIEPVKPNWQPCARLPLPSPPSLTGLRCDLALPPLRSRPFG